MKRVTKEKKELELLTVWVPTEYFKLLAQGVKKTDTDRSKFVRAAIREKLASHGVHLTQEVSR